MLWQHARALVPSPGERTESWTKARLLFCPSFHPGPFMIDCMLLAQHRFLSIYCLYTISWYPHLCCLPFALPFALAIPTPHLYNSWHLQADGWSFLFRVASLSMCWQWTILIQSHFSQRKLWQLWEVVRVWPEKQPYIMIVSWWDPL